MNRQEMIQQVKKQLAIDLNCVVTDFDQPGICFCPALDLPGRRPFPRKIQFLIWSLLVWVPLSVHQNGCCLV